MLLFSGHFIHESNQNCQKVIFGFVTPLDHCAMYEFQCQTTIKIINCTKSILSFKCRMKYSTQLSCRLKYSAQWSKGVTKPLKWPNWLKKVFFVDLDHLRWLLTCFNDEIFEKIFKKITFSALKRHESAQKCYNPVK